MKITRLRAANPEGYYMEVIARGAEEYYVRGRDLPGKWVGRGSARLGLNGRVERDDLRALLQQRHPRTGEKLTARRLRRVGFDLTLSAPKSVSLLWALGNREKSAVALAAQRAAAEATIEYLEDHACRVRRGGQNGYGVSVEPGRGLIGAAFLHFTSRAADPQVHTHLVIANMTEGPDGRHTALHGTALFEHRRAAGYMYQAVLRHELHQRLGVAFADVTKGAAEILGIPTTTLRLFSRRRVAIERELANTGGSGERASQTASLKTRPAKNRNLDLLDLIAGWRDLGAKAGIDIDRLSIGRRPPLLPTNEQIAAGLVADRATFSATDLVATTAELCRYGAPRADIERHAQSFLDSPLAVDLGHDRWTTTEILELERRSIDIARERRRAGAGIVDLPVLVDAIASRPSLSREQRIMVQVLTTTGAGVDLVVGVPGSGKTFALGAARIAWEASGYQVVGCALAAKTAFGLQADSAIPSSSIERLRGAIDRGRLELTERTVLVCDEASMVGTRDLATLIDITGRAGAKLVLVGDPKQLPPIEAGGLYPALERRLGATKLVQNRRQRNGDERRIVRDLRDGDIGRAVARLQRTGRLTVGPDPDDLLDQMVADWATARAEGTDAVMIALTNDAVAELNARAHDYLVARGELGETVAEIEDTGVEYAVGDLVLCLKNDYRAGIHNGDVATVTGASETSLLVDRDGDQIGVPARYLAAGHLDHGYALTVHKAQGATFDQALLFGDEHLYAEAGYTSLTRGRDGNRVYALSDDALEAAPLVSLADRLGRSRSETAAVEFGL